MARQFDGVTTFASSDDRCKVIKAICRSDKEIALDLECLYDDGSRHVYSGVLNSKDGVSFTGEFTFVGLREASAQVRCRVYWGFDDLLLVGSWKEEGDLYDWLVMLDELDELDHPNAA